MKLQSIAGGGGVVSGDANRMPTRLDQVEAALQNLLGMLSNHRTLMMQTADRALGESPESDAPQALGAVGQPQPQVQIDRIDVLLSRALSETSLAEQSLKRLQALV